MLRQFLKSCLMPYRKYQGMKLQKNIFKEFRRATSQDCSNFPADISLPSDYGKAMPERVVEILFAKLSYRIGSNVLDVAHANAMDCHLKMLKILPQPNNITGIDIAKPYYDWSLYYKESVKDDITNTSFEDEVFDLIWCISSMEHFGMDNSSYTKDYKNVNSNMDKIAMEEMLRLLKKGGSLLVTVPYGKYEDHGWLRNYDEETWQEVLNTARKKAKVQEWYFKHTFHKGWFFVKSEELKYTGYYDQANFGTGGLAVAYITKKDG
jgi:SAM-dependent methyltransferase